MTTLFGRPLVFVDVETTGGHDIDVYRILKRALNGTRRRKVLLFPQALHDEVDAA